MQKLIVLFLLISSSVVVFSQSDFSNNEKFTRQDTLKGSITKERVWWNLLHYDLKVQVDAKNKYISGANTVRYEVLKKYQTMQIDLQNPMQIIQVIQNNKELSLRREGNAYFIELYETQNIGDTNEITITFQGKPKEAINPPWDGGITWKRVSDPLDSIPAQNTLLVSNFIANSNQGIGASVWWPCKDHPYDEPDNGVTISVTPPKGLMDVSNGRIKEVIANPNGTKTYQWEVTNPINSYSVNINIGDYVHFSEVYAGEKGNLDCNYYVLKQNLEQAKKQFTQVPKMLEAFEHWFGPYPFYEDSFKLVEAPYLGMEHQSSITYGNRYTNGYLGNDLSGTGWGKKFDFIIVHESGHEWFANNITNIDVADMWIHEGFTTYSEILYLDYHFGTAAGNAYLIGCRKRIKNDRPIIGAYLVNNHGSVDMYVKGAAMIHNLRQIINDDEKFREILRGLNKEFYHQSVSTQQVEAYIAQESQLELSTFFDQYLRTVKIPRLDYKIKKKKIKYRYKNTVKKFKMPLKVLIDGQETWIDPGKRWKSIKNTNPGTTFVIDPNFYIENKAVN